MTEKRKRVRKTEPRKWTPEQRQAHNARIARLGGLAKKGCVARTTEERLAMVQAFRDAVAERLDELLDLALENARGVVVAEDLDADGKPVKFYKTKPDQMAIRDLLKQVVPDLPRSVEVSTPPDRVVKVVHQYAGVKPEGGQ